MNRTDFGRYRINGPTVAAQVIDGEGLLIAFESGAYYSTQGVGGFIIDGLLHRVPIEQIAAWLCVAGESSEPPRNAELLGKEVCAFVDLLLTEGLIVADDVCVTDDSFPQGWAPAAVPPLDPPRLDKFTDLQDLLLLDPIHDVDAMGWPIAGATK